ncbi:MAG: site-2 protease family protein, partial [SAR202 cluster bacterium]|nr:site-2 protease family protein [SAR202 cluster bacterium]
PVNGAYFGRSPLRKLALVALAGPGANLVIALLASLPFRADLVEWPRSFNIRLALLFGDRAEVLISLFLAFVVFYNLILAAFNLIPLAPLDGSKVLTGILPRNLAESVQRLEPWGPGILLGVILLSFLNIPVLQNSIGPVVNFFSGLFVGHRLF